MTDKTDIGESAVGNVVVAGNARTEGGRAPITVGDFRDWLPPGSPEPELGELITRAQVLEEVHGRGIRISESTLRAREAEGILPRPIRRWRDGATRALYPSWMPQLVAFTDILLDSKSGRPGQQTPEEATKSSRSFALWLVDQSALWQAKEITEDLPNVLASVADLVTNERNRPVQASLTLRTAEGVVMATIDGIQIPDHRSETR